MNAIFSKTLKRSLCVLLFSAPILVFSQEKKERIRIRIEQNNDGKIKIDEKIADATGLSDVQKEKLIKNFQDSVLTINKGKSQGVKIEVENEIDAKKDGKRTERTYTFSDDNENENIIINKDREEPQVRIYKRQGNNNAEWFDKEGFKQELNESMESLKGNMKKMGKELKFDYRTVPDDFFADTFQSKMAIRNIEVFTNNPKTDILNVKFSAEQKGDVLIKVLDVKGNIVAKEEVKEFSGKYVGQINIGKQKGTLFVMITQGEDGTVKRIVIPANEKK